MVACVGSNWILFIWAPKHSYQDQILEGRVRILSDFHLFTSKSPKTQCQVDGLFNLTEIFSFNGSFWIYKQEAPNCREGISVSNPFIPWEGGGDIRYELHKSIPVRRCRNEWIRRDLCLFWSDWFGCWRIGLLKGAILTREICVSAQSDSSVVEKD